MPKDRTTELETALANMVASFGERDEDTLSDDEKEALEMAREALERC